MKNFNFNIDDNEILGGKELVVTFECEENAKKKNCIWIKLITGVIIGFVNGFWGGGGGMICVPLLIYAIGLPDKKAHATTLLVMLPLCIASLVTYIISDNMLWIDGLQIGVGFVVGGIVGALILKKISNVWLSIFFSLVIIAGGLKILL